MAPSTPPPPSNDELAAFTIASTASVVMSAWMARIPVMAVSLAWTASRLCRHQNIYRSNPLRLHCIATIRRSLTFSRRSHSLQCEPSPGSHAQVTMSKRGWILFLSLGVLWGMPYLLIRIAVAHIDPVVMAGSRTLLGALLLLPLALHRKALGPAFRKWGWLVAFTLIEISIPWWLLGHAEKE